MRTTMVTDQHAQSNSFIRALAVTSCIGSTVAQWFETHIVPASWSLSKTQLSYSLVLAQPRKARPCLTERLLMGRSCIISGM